MDKEEQRILNLFKWLIIISLVGIIIGASIATYNDLKQRTEQTLHIKQ